MLRRLRLATIIATLTTVIGSSATAQRPDEFTDSSSASPGISEQFVEVGILSWKPPGSDNFYPRWRHGFQAYFSDGFPPFVRVFDSQGRLLTDATIAVPSTPWVRITNVAVSPARRAAFSFIGRDDEGRTADGIGWLSTAGEVEFVSRTDEFAPEQLSFAPDGSLWVQGRKSRSDVLAHYDAMGTLNAEWEISRKEGANFGFLIPTALFAIEDRVGIIMDQKRLWVEIAPDGALLGQWPTPGGHEVTGAAMTADGDVYVSVWVPDQTVDDAPGDHLILHLDRSNGEWANVAYDHLKMSGDLGVDLHGVYGDSLIIRVDDRGFLRVRPTD